MAFERTRQSHIARCSGDSGIWKSEARSPKAKARSPKVEGLEYLVFSLIQTIFHRYQMILVFEY